MNNENSMLNSPEEFDLRKLFQIIWKSKLVIIAFTLIAAILAGVISIFVITPVYDSKFNIIINMPEKLTTRYGEYTLPITTNQQYIDLIKNNNIILEKTIVDLKEDGTKYSIEKLIRKIEIDTTDNTDNNKNSFNVKVSATNPLKAQNLAQNLYNNFEEYLYSFTLENMVSYFTNMYTTNIGTIKDRVEMNKELLKSDESLLAETPQIINQKEALNSIKDKTLNFVVLEDILNSNYTELENDIINIKQTIYSDELTIRNYSTYLEELNLLKNSIDKYYETGNVEDLKLENMKVLESNFTLASPPIAPSRKASPSHLINIIIGAFFGIAISGLFVIVKEYCKFNKSL